MRAPGRRIFLRSLAALSVLPALPAAAQDDSLKVGLTPVFLDDRMSFLARWRTWLEKRLARPVVFVQRGNYREVVDLVRSGKIDFAWICGFPYVRHRHELKLTAVPLWRGHPTYQSYLIVPADDTATRSLQDLRGRVFAYSDPDSNSGYLYPQYLLATTGENPGSFFSRTFFTWAHRKVVEAVGEGVAHGGAVDGYVWETLAEVRPELTAATRVMKRSHDLGHPPFVARPGMPRRDLERFREVLVGMAGDPEGAELLAMLRLDGFTPGQPALFDGIAYMYDRVRRT